MDLFYQEESSNSFANLLIPDDPITPRTSLTYEEVVKDLMHDEKQYLRDLHMLIKVFREEIAKLLCDSKVSIATQYTILFFFLLWKCILNLEHTFSNVSSLCLC